MSKELPSDWDSRRKKVYQRDDYECQNCGRTGGPRGAAELHAHHNVPRHSGGTHKLSNLTTYCSQCHDAIHYDTKNAPTAVSTQPDKMSIKERVMDVINSENTYCSKCMTSWTEADDYVPQDTFEFLEYDSWPREFLLPSEGNRVGSVAGAYHIRCRNCETLYGRTEDGIAPVQFDNDVSSNWYYGIIGSMCSYLVIVGFLTSSLTQPVSMYYDIKYVRGTRTKNPDMKYWVWPSFVPVLNLLVGFLYLKMVRDVEIKSNTSPVLETCPTCGSESTELPRLLPPDLIDCSECGARFKNQKFGLSNQLTLVESGSDRTGETRTVEEWKRIAASTVENESKTNLLANSDE